MNPPPCLFDLTPETLAEHLASAGMPRFRAAQVLDWVYRKGVDDFAAMTSLPAADRANLPSLLRLGRGAVCRHQVATDGTQKLLIDWSDNGPYPPGAIDPAAPARRLAVLDPASTHQTETVMIPSRSAQSGRGRRTACVSSQVGCPVGCRFCASGLGGLEGNLTPGQIVEQVWRLGRLPEVGRVSHVVFMGMGEPLANFDAVTAAIRTLHADWGLGISARRITVSTVGLPAQVRRLAAFELPVTLAISLHAPNDALRRQIIPWAEFVTVEQLVEAGQFFFDRTGREVTLEYILLGGFNDQPEHAAELARLAKRLRGNVNLIRYNEVRGLPYQRPRTDDVLAFQQTLAAADIKAHIRASRGRDIAAACGQLRHEHRAAV